jgi:polyferredoxin
MKPLYLGLATVSTIGLTLSLGAHLASLTVAELPRSVMGLHVAAMVSALPAMFAGYRLTRDYPQKLHWKAALRGCPSWMRTTVYVFFGYALINFLLFAISGGAETSAPEAVPAHVVRGFSGHWMCFFSVSAAMLYSAGYAEESDDRRRCLQGHRMQEGIKYCGECGSPIASPL